MTVFGAPNSTIVGGNANVTIIDPALITLSEEAGDAVVILTGARDVLAGNNENDTLTAQGAAESISGGTGTNTFFALGQNDIIVSHGQNDTISARGQGHKIFAGTGGTTIELLGDLDSLPGANNASVVGGKGGLTITDAGTNDTILGGGGALDITTSGDITQRPAAMRGSLARAESSLSWIPASPIRSPLAVAIPA